MTPEMLSPLQIAALQFGLRCANLWMRLWGIKASFRIGAFLGASIKLAWEAGVPRGAIAPLVEMNARAIYQHLEQTDKEG